MLVVKLVKVKSSRVHGHDRRDSLGLDKIALFDGLVNCTAAECE